MNRSTEKHYHQVLNHLYINPLEKCNLRCKICYTRKTSPILTEGEIWEFISRYRQAHPLEVITFCGGEVFTLKYFPGLINKLNGIFIQVITNGMVDRLTEIKNPNMVNLIVSIDGLKDCHDSNRGKGNFDKSVSFLKKARRLGFHTEIFSVVTKQNYDQIEEFEGYLNQELGSVVRGSRNKFGMIPTEVVVTYHPRKPLYYLKHHPVSNIEGTVAGFDYLSDIQMKEIMKNRKTFPPKGLGCYQIALMSDGKVYGCCEGTVPLGKMGDKIEVLFGRLEERLEIWERSHSGEDPPAGGDYSRIDSGPASTVGGQARMTTNNCLGCSQPDFVCGIKKFI